MSKLKVYVDTNALISLDSVSERISSPHLMGSLLSPEFNVHVTTTVRGELDEDRNPVADTWLAEQILAGNVTQVETLDSFPAGSKDNGEKSIVWDIQNGARSSQVVVVTDDRRATNLINREFPGPEVGVLTLQGHIESSLFTGGTTYADYINIAFQSGWAPIGLSGMRQQVTNGALVEATPEGLLITSPDGTNTLVGATEKFRLTEAGQVEIHARGGSVFECFLPGTPVSMWDGGTKPIEAVTAGDVVLSYDRAGRLMPGRVARIFVNEVRQVLDLFGLMVTPGHVTLCGDGPLAGRHVPVIDVLRSDGALVMQDGSLVRAATGCPVGSEGDRWVTAVVGHARKGGLVEVVEAGRIRLGTRVITAEGQDVSVLDLIWAAGGVVDEDGMIRVAEKDGGGELMPFRWTFTAALPEPEDYVLARSATTLANIHAAGEWEGAAPGMAAPAMDPAADVPVNVPLVLREAAERRTATC